MQKINTQPKEVPNQVLPLHFKRETTLQQCRQIKGALKKSFYEECTTQALVFKRSSIHFLKQDQHIVRQNLWVNILCILCIILALFKPQLMIHWEPWKYTTGIGQVSDGNRQQKFGSSWITAVHHPWGRGIQDIITIGRGSEAVITSSSVYISQGTPAAGIKSVSPWQLSNFKAQKDLSCSQLLVARPHDRKITCVEKTT